MRQHRHLRPVATISLLIIGVGLAAAASPPELNDAFLDRFVGEWRVERTMRGRMVDTHVRAEWVLKHHFVELHYGAGEAQPEYEAMVFIGFDDANKAYVCHWVDVFGGKYSLLGRGKIDDKMLALEFRFGEKQDEITNKFTFDPETKSWTSVIRQVENGEWKTFAEEKWTRADSHDSH